MPLALPVDYMKKGLYTDKYFLRSKKILGKKGINPIVRYQVFARKDSTVKGMQESVNFIRAMVGDRATIYALKDGEQYHANEPLMKIEGRVQDLVELETVYLGIISAGLSRNIDMDEIKRNAGAIVQAADGKPVLYFGARHFHWSLDEGISRICKEVGFAGCSTDIGATAWGTVGGGSTPHALELAFKAYMQENGIEGNPTVEAAKGFDECIDSAVKQIILCDTFNKEIDDSVEAAEAVKSLESTRIDTCGENYAQGAEEIVLPELYVPKKYLRGKGVSIAAVWALRMGLDERGCKELEDVVSSGFDAEKTDAFRVADKAFQGIHGKPLFHAIGTGSVAENVTYATSDIVAYHSEKNRLWVPLSKVGRREIDSDRLVGV